MLVLLEDGGSLETAAGQDTADTVAAAKAAGLEVQTFSAATAAIFGAEDALAHLLFAWPQWRCCRRLRCLFQGGNR